MNAVELLRWGGECEASGDLDGALKAYRQADELGDAEGAVCLGQIYRRRGETKHAEAAFSRGEARGHAEAPMCLGNLYCDLGEVDGAETAYRRAIAAGSTMAVLNLGLLLADRGRVEEAIGFLRQAEARGDSTATFAIGRVLEQGGDLAGATEAYRRGTDAGSADAALALGSVLLGLGDEAGAIEALNRAEAMGDQRATEFLTLALERRGAAKQSTPSSSGPQEAPKPAHAPADRAQRLINNLASGIANDYRGHAESVAQGRARVQALSRLIISSVENRSAAFRPQNVGKHQWNELSRSFEAPEYVASPPSVTSLSAAEATWEALAARVTRETRRAVDRDVDWRFDWEKKGWLAKRRNPRPPQPVPSAELWRALAELRDLFAALPTLRLAAIEEAEAAAQAELAQFDKQVAEMAATVNTAAASAASRLEQMIASLGPAAQQWQGTEWDSLGAYQGVGAIRLGEMEVPLPSIAPRIVAPALASFPLIPGLAIEAPVPQREAAIGLTKAIVFRSLLSAIPGSLRVTFIDPVSIGRSVSEFLHLADFDPRLVNTRPWSDARDIDRVVAELAEHAEKVIATFLRGQFESIAEYNASAHGLPEPHRLLVVMDYPAGFTERSSQQLLSLIENGSRCGVHTLLTYQPGADRPGLVPLQRLTHAMQTVRWAGERARVTLAEPVGVLPFDVIPDEPPQIVFTPDGHPATPHASLLRDIGQAARGSESDTVTLKHLLPSLARQAGLGTSLALPVFTPGEPSPIPGDSTTWWHASSSENVTAPIGRSGADGVTSLLFSSLEIAGGALMVGLPRSGKSTSLHAAIMTMCLLYSPDELELYLLDSKHGVEFKVYENLPHARMVSINSEREFSVAVLESLDHEIARRAQVMKREAPGKSTITGYREATGKTMPRIVVVMDEFHEIFEEDDKLGQSAFNAFSNIVRQGPFSGVHLVLASQTLSSMPAMDRPTLNLLPMRVTFMCNDLDAEYVMGEHKETRFLSRAGDGLFHPHQGRPSSRPIPFRGLLVGDVEQDALLQELRRTADTRGFTRRPIVFDGDAMVDPPANLPVIDPRRVQLTLGQPYSLREGTGPTLRRQQGNHILVVGGSIDGTAADPAAHSIMVWLLLEAHRAAFEMSVIDFIGDDEQDPSIEEVAAHLQANLFRRQRAKAVIHEVADDVRKRTIDGNYRGTRRVAFLCGIGRAPSVDSDDDWADDLRVILEDGPDVGCHLVVGASRWSDVEGCLGAQLCRSIEWRIAAGDVPSSDMEALTDHWSSKGPRPGQAVLIDLARRSAQPFRPFALPAHDLLTTMRKD